MLMWTIYQPQISPARRFHDPHRAGRIVGATAANSTRPGIFLRIDVNLSASGGINP